MNKILAFLLVILLALIARQRIELTHKEKSLELTRDSLELERDHNRLLIAIDKIREGK